jgi:mono/diheme cytochrome c family protein
MYRLLAAVATVSLLGCSEASSPYSPIEANADQTKSAQQATERLATYKKIDDSRFQIPIERSMELTASTGIQYPTTFVAPATGDAPVDVAKPEGEAPAAFATDAAKVEKGKALFAAKTCSACHSIDGSKLVGPTMKGFWGRPVAIQGAKSVWGDAAYFKESVKNPAAKISAGFPPAMPPLPLTDEEIDALQHYVASLK